MTIPKPPPLQVPGRGSTPAMADVIKCDGCGQFDDHPKWHYPPQSFHFDCTPAYVIEDATNVSHYVRDENNQPVLVGRTPIPEEEWPDHVQQAMHLRSLALKGSHKGEKLRAQAVKFQSAQNREE
jgi:hypothetical protein